ncbi:MAG: alanyl-tRNA editing protein [candidate division KSB1 bacterium]|nr:alanyl-tRNA editing protein [candidate division KSB1 bacterium]MDZ7318862.1 alanyl-tRNA editing protein [candidate division KSB1 bacterium]MDZ7339747.1 alanyl-tRNA editing protein [candidate division KSB1 bacterium]
MTELLFQTDSYIKNFPATVVAINTEENAIGLDRTAFYPGGGGQPCDIGHIQVDDLLLPVTKVKSIDGVVWHWIDGKLPAMGAQVTGHLNWDYRYQLMRTHTALHILCGVVWRDYGAQVTGGNMEPLQGRMDFEFESLQKELVHEIEEKVNLEVKQGREVRVKILPRAEAFKIPDLIRTKINLLPEQIQQVRTVEIVGLDLQADGGTHVANTREVGYIRVVDYKSKGQINKRIYIQLE